MPALPSSNFGSKELSLSFVDHRGATASLSLAVREEATDSQMDAVASTIGALTNSGIYSVTKRVQNAVRRTTAVALDEAESSVATKAVLVFESLNGEKKTVQIPAPDRRVMNSQRTGLDLTNSEVVAAVDAIREALNAGTTSGSAPDWQLRLTSITYTTRQGSSTPVLPNVNEPSPSSNQ